MILPEQGIIVFVYPPTWGVITYVVVDLEVTLMVLSVLGALAVIPVALFIADSAAAAILGLGVFGQWPKLATAFGS